MLRQHNDLRERGYLEIEEIDGIRVGARVYGRNQQYVEAYRDGTAVVLLLMEKPESPWSRKWGQRDIELVALRDVPLLSDSRIACVADYHVGLAERQP